MKNSLFVLALLISSISFAQTADEIISKHFTATGGIDKWKKITSMKSTGYYVMGPGAHAPLTNMFCTKPFKGYYSDFSWQGFTSMQAMRDDTGWSYSPWGGKRTCDPLSPNDIRSINLSSNPEGLLLNYKVLNCTVEYLGNDDVEGVETYKLRLNTPEGDMVYYYLDTETNYLIKLTRRLRFADKEDKSQTVYSDYKKTTYGIILPHYVQSVDASGNEQGGPVVIENVEINFTPDAKMFQRPVNPNQ